MEQTGVFQSIEVEDLLDLLAKSLLLSADELQRADKMASASPDGHALARDLVLAGMLTPYQMQAIKDGKAAELRIGNYDVLDRLGAGGMGIVVKARHRRMKRVVALKILSRALVKDEQFVRRFQREVETVARLSHPNIVMAYDADEDVIGPYLVMEFVDGADLASVVGTHGPFPVADAITATLHAARGLEYAHAQGIIHRDIKPANLLRDAAGTVKLTDLGLARLNSLAGSPGDSGQGSITQAGGIMGTVDYMSPEQAVDSTTIDHRADIYSLGATLYYLLVGKPPFQGNNIMATMLLHTQGAIPSLLTARKDVPPALDALYQKMMAKAPGDRTASMAAVVAALEAVAADKVAAPAPAAPVPAGGGASPTAASASSGILLKVLLVEPSRTQAGIIRKYLQSGGIEHVVTAASGAEALAAARAEPLHAVVSTQHLPDMTGVELAQGIRAANLEKLPGFVLISSASDGAEAEALSQCGPLFQLQKPFTPEQLVGALKAVSNKAPRAALTPEGRAALRVLVVDDSAAARAHVRNVLTSLGLSKFTDAPDGAQAVSIVAREAFDLIVTDYNMPLMDGLALVGYLKQNPATAKLPVIMVTTETDPEKLAAVRQLGVTEICEKRFPADIVGKIIDRLGAPA